jgi:hypothetical protein
MAWDRLGTVAQGLFTFQFLMILRNIRTSTPPVSHDLTETLA